MKPTTIAVFGGSGLTGRAVIAAALKRGACVQALYRPGSDPSEVPAGLRVVTGELTDPNAVREVLRGADGAVIVFGPRLGTPFSRPPEPPRPFCAPATALIISAMKELGMRRLVCQTGAMAGGSTSNLSPFVARFAARYRRNYPAIAADRDAQEHLVRDSGLDWTLFKPFRISGARGGRPTRVAPALRIGALTSIPRADLAELLVNEVMGGRFHEQAVYAVKDSRRAA